MPDEHSSDQHDADATEHTDTTTGQSDAGAAPIRRPMRRPRPSATYTVGRRARVQEPRGLSPIIVPIFAAVALLALVVALIFDHFHSSPSAASVPATATIAPVPTVAPTKTPIPMPAPPTTRSGVAAEVNGEVVPMSLYSTMVRVDGNSLQAGGTDPTTGQPTPAVDLSKPAGLKIFHQHEQSDLTQLIQTYAAIAYAKQHKLVATQKQVQTQLNSYYSQAGGKAAFLQRVESVGYTESAVNTIIANGVTEQNVFAVIGKQAPYDGKIVRHILLATKDKALADKLAKELQADHGSNFAALAKKYSTDTQSAAQGGSLGVVTHGQMVAPFDKAVFSLKYGQISNPVKSQYGWHIIEVLGPGQSQTS
ncbi:MAG TPA: peptidylprolyl isomerase, partial [Chloroflexota bacterium]|nr:peptidylprolyl isomerase [Chloroflexota bacterium]